jgi:hypothetical protein
MGQTANTRRFSRVGFRITAAIESGDQRIVGVVENMSMRGVFVATEKRLSIGDDAKIIISLGDQPGAQPAAFNEDDQVIEVHGRVARITDDGIAFVFDKIDFDSYVHLKNIIVLNTGDGSRADEEMSMFLESQPDYLQK